MWSGKSKSILLNDFKKANLSPTFLAVITLGGIIIAFLLSYGAFANTIYDNTTLKQVHVVFRHGQKNPTSTYPNDPYKGKEYWPDGWGQLTKKGKSQLYELGMRLRRRYNLFLNEHYTPDEILMRSSYADRCQMSAMTLLAGLYPPVDNQIWNPNILWQPIPINSIPRNMDQLITMHAECPRLQYERELINSKLHEMMSEDEKTLIDYLSKHTGKKIESFFEVEDIYFNLLIQDENNLRLPEWAETIYPNKLYQIALKVLQSFTQNSVMKKLHSGPMIKEWITNMLSIKNANHSNPDTTKKLYLYSAHDVTLISLLRTLEIEQTTLPGYGSAMVIELHQAANEEYNIKIFYFSSSSEKFPKNLNIPKCEDYCLLDKFISIYSPILPNNWQTDCSHVPSEG